MLLKDYSFQSARPEGAHPERHDRVAAAVLGRQTGQFLARVRHGSAHESVSEHREPVDGPPLQGPAAHAHGDADEAQQRSGKVEAITGSSHARNDLRQLSTR